MSSGSVFQYNIRMLNVFKALDEPPDNFYLTCFGDATKRTSPTRISVSVGGNLFYKRHPDVLVFGSSIINGGKVIALQQKTGELWWSVEIYSSGFGNLEMAILERAAEIVDEKYKHYMEGVK